MHPTRYIARFLPLRRTEKRYNSLHLIAGEHFCIVFIPYGLHRLPHSACLVHLAAEKSQRTVVAIIGVVHLCQLTEIVFLDFETYYNFNYNLLKSEITDYRWWRQIQKSPPFPRKSQLTQEWEQNQACLDYAERQGRKEVLNFSSKKSRILPKNCHILPANVRKTNDRKVENFYHICAIFCTKRRKMAASRGAARATYSSISTF